MTHPSAYSLLRGVFAQKQRDTMFYTSVPLIFFRLLKRIYLIMILPSPYGLA